jgi:hypothetical protein
MKKEMSFCALKVDPVEINGKVVKIMIIMVPFTSDSCSRTFLSTPCTQ